MYKYKNTKHRKFKKNELFCLNCGKSNHLCNVCAEPSNSYGMPSGHSQSAVFFSTYVIMNLIDSNVIMYEKILGVNVFIFLALGVMYSRVYLRCHTTQQVIVGGLIGAILGTLYYKNKDTIKNLIIM